jgi:hypothetical protein
MAVSKNGGLKFDYYKINDKSFKPVKQVFFGDYIGLSAVNNVIRPIWMQIDDNKELCIYTAILNDSILTGLNKNTNEISFNKSHQFSKKIKINLNVNSTVSLTAAITKPLEPGFEKIILENKLLKKGKREFIINTKKLKLEKNNYVVTFYFNGKNDFAWIIKE